MAGYYEVPGLPYPKRQPLPGEADPDSVESLSAGAPMSAADRIRASVQRTGVPANYAENRFGTMTPSREVEGRPPAGGIPVNKMNANFDQRGQPIAPNYGGAGVRSAVKALVPEALPGLENAAEQGQTVYGRNETTGQDFEYVPRKRVDPTIAIAIVREARRKAALAEQGVQEDKRFGHQVALAEIPGKQELARTQLQSDLAIKQQQARQSDPMYQENLAALQEERRARGEDRQYQLDQRKQQLSPSQQRVLDRLERMAETGSPQVRATAMRSIDRILGVNQERTGRIGDEPQDGYGDVNQGDEDKWRARLGPSLEGLSRVFDTGMYRSAHEQAKINFAIRSIKTKATRAGIPPEYVDELIAEYRNMYD